MSAITSNIMGSSDSGGTRSHIGAGAPSNFGAPGVLVVRTKG
jgi:hypothetical protein